MENKLQLVFEGHEVALLTKRCVNFEFKGDFIISARDVAKVLDYQGKNATPNVLKFCKAEHIYRVNNSDLLNQGVRKLNNAGEKFISNLSLNRVMGQSGQPKAMKFQDWLYEDIVPSIQKHGMYAIDDLLDNPDLLIQTAQRLKEERELRIAAESKNKMLQTKIEENKPKVEFADTIIKSDDNILVREMSKLIQQEGINIGEKKLYKFLRDWNYILRHKNEPTQYAMNQGLFVVDERVVRTEHGNKITTTPKVTPKGQIRIVKKIKKELALV